MSFPGESGERERSGQPQGFGGSKADGFSAQGGDGRRQDSGELDLGDDDIRLPWLEGDDDDDLEETGPSTGQLLVFVLLGVVVLALIVGAVWWVQRDGAGDTLVADGATIEAPDAPYKTRPQNPGGEFVEGSGDTSFAVAEGQTRQVRMESQAPAPVATPAADPTADTPAGAEAGPASPAPTGIGVQVAAYSTRELAEQGWSRLSQQYEMLSGMRYRIVEGRADIGTVYRLQLVPGDLAAANQLCADLKNAGLSCQVKR
ncbi:SPOR domain-containing protein [Novosphingobium sp. M1R2S20]|uniref:SPOR domain-containing protein n=1 Tax=Novosphingobium rhizovicinum TaxID=3228928 RepID=A0ABV3R9B1_9SPHN